jgi:hypothetical protein
VAARGTGLGGGVAARGTGLGGGVAARGIGLGGGVAARGTGLGGGGVVGPTGFSRQHVSSRFSFTMLCFTMSATPNGPNERIRPT